MESVVIIRHLKIERANAVAGVTWGFPAITQFLGAVHRISRALAEQFKITDALDGVAIVCHQHHPLAQQNTYGDHRFTQARAPLTKEGKTAPFNEEGKMHLEVSLVVSSNHFAGKRSAELAEFIELQLKQMNVAGGRVNSIEQVEWRSLSEPGANSPRERELKHILLSLLPGFALVGREDILREIAEPDGEVMARWLDLFAYQEAYDEDTEQWAVKPRAYSGWLVPLAVGYQAISPLYEAGEMIDARDQSVPTQFVETIYGVGEWISPHRLNSLESALWRYQHDSGLYLCANTYQMNVSKQGATQ